MSDPMLENILTKSFPFKRNFINRNGHQYHYVNEGQGSPVVMVHGNPSWSFYYRNLIQNFKDRYPSELSGGQQQRVSLCHAMMLKPPLLLLDEPFSALDPVTRDIIYDEFLKLQQAEIRSIVLVTHDMFEATKLAQQIIVLCDGKIEQQGTVAEIENNPASDYVEALFRAGGNAHA